MYSFTKRLQKFVTLFSLLSVCLVQVLSAKNWAPHDRSLKPDDRVIWGTLDNGFRYAIMYNQEPPENVSLRFLVQAGSLMEEEDQRGLAHFLEHMAFNGTKNYSPGELIEYFQRLGMEFGADTTAHTGFGETVYKLELPKNYSSYLDDGMQVFRDFADGILLDDHEIDEERGVIMAEKRARDSIEWRTAVSFYDFIGSETLVPHRLPIGIDSVITGAPRERFTSFYNKWYTTDRMALVVVGDVSPEAVKPFIEKHFSSLPKVDNPIPHRSLSDINVSNKLHAKLHSEKESTSVDVTLLKLKPYVNRLDTIERHMRKIKQNIAISILNRRLEVISKKEESPVSSGVMYYSDFVEAFDIVGLKVKSQPDVWQAAVAVLEQQLRKALKFGFTEDEIDEAVANAINTYEEAVRLASTRLSNSISTEISNSISGKYVYSSPEDKLELVMNVANEITAESLHEDFKEMWEGEGKDMIFVDGNLELEAPEQMILEAYTKSTHEEVVEPVAREVAQFAYTYFGIPGKVVEHNFDEKLNIHQIRFDNNVRLNLKDTNFEANRIRIGVRFGGGELDSIDQKSGIVMLASEIFVEGGLEAHSIDDLERILAGKTVGVTFTVGNDAFNMSGRTNPKDLKLQLDLMCAYMTAPGYRPEALRKARKAFEQVLPRIKQVPEGVIRSKVNEFLAGADPRFGLPREHDVMQLTLDDVKNWLTGLLQKSYLEISIVGDFKDVNAVIDNVANTFGALPRREVTKEPYKNERIVKFPEKVREKEFFIESKIPKAVSLVCWPTVSMTDIKCARQLSLLSRIFTDRLRVEVREKLGDAYSPYALNDSSLTYENYGKFYGVSTVTPEKVGEVSEIILGIGDNLAQKGITEDELERSLMPTLVNIDRTLRNNDYWMNVLAMSQEKPEMLEWAKTYRDMYESMTVDDMNKAAKTFLTPKKAIRVLVTPGTHSDEGDNK